MVHDKRGGRERRPKRTWSWRFFPALLAMILLVPVTGALAQAQDTSGTVQLGNALQYGNTSYSVKYSYPSTAEVGTNLTITVTLHVDSLTGLVEYTTNYGLVAELFVGSQHLEGSVSSTQNATFLYPGSYWGPNNITIPLTANNTGVVQGESENATLSITLRDSVYYGGQQLNVVTTEPRMQGLVGSLVIQNSVTSTSTSTTASGTGQSYVPYAILAGAGAVLMLGAVLWPRGPPQGRKEPKS
jgi:hypothetical protein